MCALRLYSGNRLETLVDILADILRVPLSSPMAPETVVVQSKGMEHWISLELARRHGVCANIRFPFPNRFVEDLDRRVTGGAPSSPSAFDPRWLRWRILRLFKGLVRQPEFAHVQEYLSGEEQGLRPMQLADRMSDTLDQYLVYRPDMIDRWERGEEHGWQASLWRALTEELPGETHRLARAKALMAALATSPPPRVLPERVSVFGISSLPRFHMDILAALARYIPVNLFLMNPCREYWGDILNERDISRVTAGSVGEPSASYLHLEQGHPLLASMGMMGRDFFDMVQDDTGEGHDLFLDPGRTCLLHALQSDILHLRNRSQPGERVPVDPDDDSVRIHACHSPLREVEVLHDRLLDWFEREPDLRPTDVLVTMPDIETYTPFIRAVFDVPETSAQRIPYSIADRSLRGESDLIASFMSLLELGRDRYTLSKVLSVLESPATLRRFGLTSRDLESLRTWLPDSGVRWGLDGRDREKRGLPAFEENTWTAGLQRLLLGYAMKGGEARTFLGHLPYDRVEGADADVLEKLLDFASAMFELLPSLERPRPPDAWGQTLQQILERFFDPGEDAQQEAASLRRATSELIEAADPDGPAVREPLTLEVIRWILRRRLEREGLGFGFMTGGITFCAMLPMRSIPFRIICCLGLDSDAFPRTRRAPSFDLIAQHPRKGDRSMRKDDRYLFLEMLLSARDHLHLSYVGQSLQDNAPIPPSPLVVELLDVIDQGFETEGESIRDRVVVRHPLHPFSPDLFSGKEPLFSYSRENLLAAEAMTGKPEDHRPFFPERLSRPDSEWDEVDLEDLIRFFGNPSRYLLRRRLGVALQEPGGLPEDREPFSIAGLERYMLGQDLVERAGKGEDPRAGYEWARAGGHLPHGSAGRALFEELARNAKAFSEQTGPFFCGDPLDPVPVDLEIEGFHLKGRLEAVFSSGLVHRRFATLKAKDRLNGWIRHLALNAVAADPSIARNSVVVGLSSNRGSKTRWSAVRFEPVCDADDLLLRLLHLYREGLRFPLAFFPASSWIYAQTLRSGKASAKESLKKARKIWEGNPYAKGEREDPYVSLAFRNLDPLENEAFGRIALEVFEPMMDHEVDDA